MCVLHGCALIRLRGRCIWDVNAKLYSIFSRNSMQSNRKCLQQYEGIIMEYPHEALPIVFVFLCEKYAVLLRVCLLIFYIMLHCLHHVDFLRIVRSWISTNGRQWNMKVRSGDLHQLDADGDEGTLWRKDIGDVFVCKDEHEGLDEQMLWKFGKPVGFFFCVTGTKWTFRVKKDYTLNLGC